MRKIIPLTFMVSLFLLTGRAVGAASVQFEQAETYMQNKQYELAEAIYKDIAANLPGTDEALQARKNLAILYSKMGDHMHPAAKKEADALIADFTDHPELPAEVYNIAEQFWHRKRDFSRYWPSIMTNGMTHPKKIIKKLKKTVNTLRFRNAPPYGGFSASVSVKAAGKWFAGCVLWANRPFCS